MKILNRYYKSLIVLFIISFSAASHAADLSGQALVGYTGGLGFQMNLIASDFAKGFPLNLQFGVSYSGRNPGNAADARKIFINDATNGDPEKSGSMWDFRFDFLYKVDWLSLHRGYLYGGPRYSMFTANFQFIGGNEFFEVSTNQWGIGFGMKAFFEISRRLDFVTSAGFDYFFDNEISGHDTSYSPDGEDVNPRNGFTYDDADAAINNPTLQLRLMVGVDYHF